MYHMHKLEDSGATIKVLPEYFKYLYTFISRTVIRSWAPSPALLGRSIPTPLSRTDNVHTINLFSAMVSQCTLYEYQCRIVARRSAFSAPGTLMDVEERQRSDHRSD